ncbi:hypothetical protein RB195_017598 [Necator americanus]|uniref:Tc1-like transposase DDE domain-containing protein n=1 Tax=Necator americanus TaxID=51031 RepID=A0ABR1C5Y5_NECAM
MLCIWWSVHGVEYWELLAQGCTVTADVYVEQLRNLKTNLENARPQQREVYFQHDNTQSHIGKMTKAELNKFFWTISPHPPYSPDLASSDYHLFSISNIIWMVKTSKPATTSKGTRAVLQGTVPGVLE